MVIAWFSCGATSAVACKIALTMYTDVRIVYIETGSGHPDNERFIQDCERWYGRRIERIRSEKYRNVDDVLNIVYENTVIKIRSSIASKFDPEGDFFEQVIDIVAKTLVMSYENKMNFNQYVFQSDSISNKNYEWWKREIRRLIEFGKSKGCIKDVDTEIMCYAIWCFIRGYNADAVGRKLPMDVAVKNFRYSFGVLLDGMKA